MQEATQHLGTMIKFAIQGSRLSKDNRRRSVVRPAAQKVHRSSIENDASRHRDLDLLERRDACMREISPSPLTSKASSVGSHYDPLPFGLKKQGMNFTCPQLVLIGTQCVSQNRTVALSFDLWRVPPPINISDMSAVVAISANFNLGVGVLPRISRRRREPGFLVRSV